MILKLVKKLRKINFNENFHCRIKSSFYGLAQVLNKKNKIIV
jgi:hypothetical protein